jgi:aryl-alcohol dehydrogenase-like predicted oxidoreductase
LTKLTTLGLGTVQFGMNYGVANTAGQPQPRAIQEILTRAADLGVDLLDTAEGYGKAEATLGTLNTSSFKIVTKLGEVKNFEEIPIRFKACLDRLNRDSVHSVLLHRPQVLFESGGGRVFEALQKLVGAGKIGASTYTPEETEALIDRFPLRLLQIPLAPIDARWDATLARLSAADIEVHTRSALLQGLLAIGPELRPPYFQRWRKLFSSWDAWCLDHQLERAAAALALARRHHSVDRVIFGVDNVSQLESLLVSPNELPPLPDDLKIFDPELLNPGLWPRNLN